MTKIESNLLVCKEVAFEKVTILSSRLSISEKYDLGSSSYATFEDLWFQGGHSFDVPWMIEHC